ncbi:MAG TPA: DUF835 domain-containing protein [Thermococcus paralvinellae]|uniref:DUF835 domain-containing protein n=1 Tax=Thermococcus paralvinellae TaxID=582419 RepID=A0A833E0E4_9EURY|nr:DUF835 domain-containing protein [Thermococcus paralvinellae]HIP89355.1 DUF835 domain-containing protein [Thermococcus paralvinellae]
MIGIPDKITFVSDLLNLIFVLIVFIFTFRYKEKFINKFPSLKGFYKTIIISLGIAVLGNVIDVIDEIEINGKYLKSQFTSQLTSWIFAITIALIGLAWIKLLITIIEKQRQIPIVKESANETGTIYLDPGVYLCSDEESCHELFKAFLGKFPGLVITRDPPDVTKERLGLKETPILWLTKIEGTQNTVYPTNLAYLMQTLVDFMKMEGKPKVILLEGIEYLITENGFPAIFKFLATLKDHALVSNSIVLVPFESKAFEERELHLLLREFELLR